LWARSRESLEITLREWLRSPSGSCWQPSWWWHSAARWRRGPRWRCSRYAVPDERRPRLRQMRLAAIPFMGLLFVVSFIDRTNAGFAALTMNKDLGFSPTVFGFGAGAFFVGYALFMVPANVILERIGARRWVFCILALWGLLSASNALVQSPTSFYALRFLLGVAEAGFAPGMFLYLTYWFPRVHLARVTANFMVAMPLSFVVGGPLSGLILGMDGVAGLRGWQWLFLIKGVPAFLLSFAVLKLLPDGPNDAPWLTAGRRRRLPSAWPPRSRPAGVTCGEPCATRAFLRSASPISASRPVTTASVTECGRSAGQSARLARLPK